MHNTTQFKIKSYLILFLMGVLLDWKLRTKKSSSNSRFYKICSTLFFIGFETEKNYTFTLWFFKHFANWKQVSVKYHTERSINIEQPVLFIKNPPKWVLCSFLYLYEVFLCFFLDFLDI